jgi:hypothetical protein
VEAARKKLSVSAILLGIIGESITRFATERLPGPVAGGTR